MFTTVRYFIKTSLAFLFVGITTGLYLSVERHVLNRGISPDLVSAHAHLILAGSVMMMIMGVALWLFPKVLTEDTRYNPDLIRFAYWLMTIATSVRFLSQATVALVELRELRWFITASSTFQVVAFGLYFYSMWGRIRAAGSAQREANGEKF
ncbi:MAG TPA: cbb3-type cytochrome c oxidase subunit I [Bacteroidota bacterium]